MYVLSSRSKGYGISCQEICVRPPIVLTHLMVSVKLQVDIEEISRRKEVKDQARKTVEKFADTLKVRG